MKLTEEQAEIVNSSSRALRVVAFAGAGKTSTLKAFADARPNKNMVYLAFNKAIQMEAQSKFPRNVKCITTHSLAYAAIGKDFRNKLRPNVRPHEAAKALHLNAQNSQAIGFAKEAIDLMTGFLSTGYFSFEQYLENVLGKVDTPISVAAQKLWLSMVDRNDLGMPMLHDGYLTLYQLTSPVLSYDYILFDEAQDANPVTLAILKSQKAAKIFVGDPHQQIYQFRGAENAMDDPMMRDTLYLTESFRFDSKVADVANTLLRLKGESRNIRGGRTKPPSDSSAFLTRGNAAIFRQAYELSGDKKPIHFVGGIEGYKFDLLLDIWHLYSDEKNRIRDQFIKHFTEFWHLKKYAENHNERDLSAWVNVVEKSGIIVPAAIDRIRTCAVNSAEDAYMSLATAHKSKGLEFGSVTLADDFPGAQLIEEPGREERAPDHPVKWMFGPSYYPSTWRDRHFLGHIRLEEEEVNLRYVVCTRSEGNLHTSKWGSPVFSNLRDYIGKHPNFSYNPVEVKKSGNAPAKRVAVMNQHKTVVVTKPFVKKAARTGPVDRNALWVGAMDSGKLYVFDPDARVANSPKLYLWPVGGNYMHVDTADGLRSKLSTVTDERKESALQQYAVWKQQNWTRFLERRSREF